MTENQEQKTKVRERIKIIGMHCATCAVTIEKTSKQLPGVENVSVSLAQEEAVVEYDPYSVSLKDLVKAVRKVGYDVYKEEARLIVENLSSPDDESLIESTLSKMPGVIDVKTSHISKVVYVTINPFTTSFEDVKTKLEELGYRVKEVDTKADVEDIERKIIEEELRTLKRHVILSLGLGLPLMIYVLLPVFGIEQPLKEFSGWIGFLLSTPVVFIAGRRFYLGAYRALRNGVANMDTLVALGTGAAYVFSTAALLGLVEAEEVFFEAAAVVIGFIILGRYLEVKMKLRTGEAVRKLMELQAGKARVIRDGEEVELPIDEVRVKDIVVVRPGEKIPVDGIIVEGSGYVNESMLTGESIPVYKKERDPVFAGTILENGYIKVIATRVGRETVLSQIIKLVRYAQSAKPPIQKTVDRISGIFTWLVIGIAIVTFSIWYFYLGVGLSKALLFTASVLLISCPCALGLAAPTAIIVGVGKAAEKGIIIRNIDVLEKVDELTVFVFDKTGTLTVGKPQVTSVKAYNGFEEGSVLRLAAIAEKGSEHPIGKAIIEAAEGRGLELGEPESFDYIPGQGIYAVIDGRTVVVGNEKLMKGFEVDVELSREDVSRLRDEGMTVVYVAVDGVLAGIVAVADVLKEDSVETINRLREMGYKIVMLTGDHRRTAEAIARKLGIDEVYAEVSPEDKADKVRELQRRGEKVAMVGDGVNDAPSLTQADVGFAMGSGSDIAKEAGDVIIVGSRIMAVVQSIRISKMIKRKIKFNLFWAFIYNTLLIPVAAGILYPLGVILRPEHAGFAMAMSSISVTSNSLRMSIPED